MLRDSNKYPIMICGDSNSHKGLCLWIRRIGNSSSIGLPTFNNIRNQLFSSTCDLSTFTSDPQNFCKFKFLCKHIIVKIKKFFII